MEYKPQGTKEMLEDLSEEFGNEVLMDGRIEEYNGKYYQVVLGEEGEESFEIDEKYYPIINRYLY